MRLGGPSGHTGYTMTAVRAFIAVRVGVLLRDAVAALLDTLKPRMPDGVVRWVQPDDFHLTLKFLGNVPETQVPAVLETVRAVASEHWRAEVPVVGAGMFPPRGNPHALWLGLQNGDALRCVAALHAQMEARVSPLGFPAEKRPFKAHLTLGRVAKELKHGDPVMRFLKRTEAVPGAGPVA